MSDDFSSPFDAALADSATAAVFLIDAQGKLRFEPMWTRDAWGRMPGPYAAGRTWWMAVDQASGFAFVVMTNVRDLFPTEGEPAHPRLVFERFASREDAAAASRRRNEGSLC